MSSLRRRWPEAFVTALAVTLGAALYTLGQTRIYQAAATIQLEPTGSGSHWDNHEYYETQYRIIASTRVASAVVAELGLDHDPAFIQNAPPGKQLPPGSAPEETAVEALRARLRVEPVRDTRLAVVKLEDADPERARRVLRAVVETYVAMNADEARAGATQAKAWLEGQLEHMKSDLEDSESRLHDFKSDRNVLAVSPEDQASMLREEIRQITASLTQVRIKREEIAARRDELAKVLPGSPASLPASELLSSARLVELRRAHADAARERDALLEAGKEKGHPDVAAAEARAGRAREGIAVEVKSIHAALDRDFAAIKRQEAALAGLLDGARKQALEINELEVEYGRLRRDKDGSEKLYAMVLERTHETDLARMMRGNNVRVVDPPLLPADPVRPRVPLGIGGGILAGLVLGLAAALVRARADRRDSPAPAASAEHPV